MKCKLLRMSLLCLLFLFTFCISVSFGSSIYENELSEFNYSGSLTDLFNYLFDNAYNMNLTEYRSNINNSSLSATNKTNYNNYLNTIENVLNNGSSYNIYMVYAPSETSTKLWFYYNNSSATSNYTRYRMGFNTSGPTMNTTTNQNIRIPDTSTSYTCYFWNMQKFYSSNINVLPNPTNNLKFVSSSSDTINLTFNGVTEQFIRYNFNQYSSNINLGNLENITGYREIQCNLYIMQANGNTFVYDNLGGFTYYSLYGINNAFLTGVDHGTYLSVQVNQSKLYKNQAYILKATGYRSDNSSSETTTNIYFLAYGDSSSSGDPINPDAEDPSIDWNLINTFNNGIDGPSGNTEFINNFYLLPSGDSGDTLFGFKYNYDDHGLGLGNFILQFVSDFYNFTTNYNNVSMDFGFLGVISSSDFISPNNAFFTLISFIINAILCLVIIRFVFKLYQNIATFDIDKFINDNEDFILF